MPKSDPNILIVQTWLSTVELDREPDLGRRWVLRVARDTTKMNMAIIQSYDCKPYIIPGTTSIRARVWVQ